MRLELEIYVQFILYAHSHTNNSIFEVAKFVDHLPLSLSSALNIYIYIYIDIYLSLKAEEEESAPKQSLFSVKIDRFDDSKKIALIKEVKKIMEGMNLVQVSDNKEINV